MAQDENNHIFPIVFAIVEGETKNDWFFFLKNLRTYITPQSGLCLISVVTKLSRASTIEKTMGGGDNKQFMCITFDTLDKISYASIRMLKCANKLSKWVSNTFMSITFFRIIYVTMLTILRLSSIYTFMEMIFNPHYNDLRSNNVEAASWLKCIPKQK